MSDVYGHLKISGTAALAGDGPWDVRRAGLGLRVEHNPRRDPVACISMKLDADGNVLIEGDIPTGRSTPERLLVLSMCPQFGLGWRIVGHLNEVMECSLLQMPANVAPDDRLMRRLEGRLPRVTPGLDTFFKETRNPGRIEVYEVGYDAWDNLVEITPGGDVVEVPDRMARKELYPWW